MSSLQQHPAWGQFVRIFNAIAQHQHRYTVFQDFVTMAAIALHNAVRKDEGLESEYLQIVKRYTPDEARDMSRLLACLIELLEAEPMDVLGQLYMMLELGNTNAGQFFTPPDISELMARLACGDQFKDLSEPFITVSEPACGAGGMVLAFVKVMLSYGHNPAERLWVECWDIDRTAALMCYLQLSLWHVPGVMIVGNTLHMQAREAFYTPAHHLGLWGVKLKRREAERQALQLLQGQADPVPPEASDATDPEVKRREAKFAMETGATETETDGSMNPVEGVVRPLMPPSDGRQLGFDFEL